ncbi:Hypothetical predicted protein [Pelobates cultripes]|uniref:Uncharacterized protein n=1 Tax=Pelobates cultripes TaxID=61616 RepID=A0AAD1SS06_PELCU|nr:Hypothetical predicted protein [Pelobates cultripes]
MAAKNKPKLDKAAYFAQKPSKQKKPPERKEQRRRRRTQRTKLRSNYESQPQKPTPGRIQSAANLRRPLSSPTTSTLITTSLQSQNVPYHWGFPTKIQVLKNGTLHMIRTVEEGRKLLRDWDIPIQDPKHLPAPGPRRLNPELQKAP